MEINKEIQVFLSLLRAGLWGKKELDLSIDGVDLNNVFCIAQGQSVVGIVAAGLEDDARFANEDLLSYASISLQIEQRNRAMNGFVARLVEKLQDAGVIALLVKGQGVAQCYDQPMLRASGDIDLFLDQENYEKAKSLLLPLASSVEDEVKQESHLGMSFGQWAVELHGSLRSCLLPRMDRVIDDVQHDTFFNHKVREWENGGIKVLLPCPDNDVFFIFTHILKHFFKGGIGLRQICDWCRLLWVYKESLDMELLGMRIKDAGIMAEWKAFAALGVEYLGMPSNAMPFYSDDSKWSNKSKKILSFVLYTGNFGNNREIGKWKKYPYVIRKAISLWRHTMDSCRRLTLFPLNTVSAWNCILSYGIAQAVRGK